MVSQTRKLRGDGRDGDAVPSPEFPNPPNSRVPNPQSPVHTAPVSSLSGKTALVTGASSGIGHAIAATLRAEGATVFGLCRSIGKLPEGVTPIACDLRDPGRIAHAFEILDAATPDLDILVNNAGVAYLARLSDGDPADWDEMWEVNVRATALCIQHALKRFPESGGRIVNISSLSGHRVPPTGGFYAPTKFAVKALSDDSDLTGPATTSQVMCLSCHRAHASGFEYAIRWNPESEMITYAGAWPGTDNGAPSQYARGRTAAEMLAAYNDYPATTFATYQRSLCNKCHIQD